MTNERIEDRLQLRTAQKTQAALDKIDSKSMTLKGQAGSYALTKAILRNREAIELTSAFKLRTLPKLWDRALKPPEVKIKGNDAPTQT